MKKTLLLVFLLTCAVLYIAKAQGGINVSPDGDACPNREYTYTYTGSGIGCKWVVKGESSIVSGGGVGSTSITVRWKDVPTDANSNPTSIAMDCGTGGTTTRAVFVSSISNVTPGPLTVNGTAVGAQFALPFGDNTALTLKVPPVELPRSSAGAVPLYALTYEWVIPADWRYSDGYVSNGSTPHRLSGSPQAGNQIAVTPAPGTDGTISVRAVNNNCINASTGPDNSLSQTLNVSVTRPTPTLTIVSDKTPNGGNFSLNCGDQSDYHFRVVVAPIPSGGSFSNQAFQVTAPLTATGPLTGSYAVNTAFSGATGLAGLLFRARYTRNGASTDVYAAVQIDVKSSLAPISFVNLPTHLCNGESAILRANQVVGASQYTWTLPAILTTTATPTTPGGRDYVTTTPQLPITVGGNAYLYTYRVAVQVAAGSASCGSSSTTGTFVVGLAEQINVSSSSQTSSQNPYQVCANQPIHFAVTLDGQQANVTGYDWVVNDAAYAPGNGSSAINLYSPPAGQSLHVIATVHSPCGDLTRGVYVTSANSIDGQPCEQFFTGPSQPAEQMAAYPNPADRDLTLEQGGGTVRLSDAYGKPVRSQATRPGRLHLDTSRLPAGLYFLEMRDGKGQPVRKQIQVRH